MSTKSTRSTRPTSSRGSRGSQRILRGSQRIPRGFPEDPQRIPRGSPEDPQRIPRGSPEDPQRIPRGFPEDPQRIPRGSPEDSQRIPRGFPEDPQRIPRGSQRAQRVQGVNRVNGEIKIKILNGIYSQHIHGSDTRSRDFKQWNVTSVFLTRKKNSCELHCIAQSLSSCKFTDTMKSDCT
jgi:hypothetical protein